jgi:hypothetical protein
MRVYARTRTPDGSLLRASYDGGSLSEESRAADPIGSGTVVSDPSAGLTWWDRWCLLGALEHGEYQRLF